MTATKNVILVRDTTAHSLHDCGCWTRGTGFSADAGKHWICGQHWAQLTAYVADAAPFVVSYLNEQKRPLTAKAIARHAGIGVELTTAALVLAAERGEVRRASSNLWQAIAAEPSDSEDEGPWRD